MEEIKVFIKSGKIFFLESKLNDTSTQLTGKRRKFGERGENFVTPENQT